MSKHLIDQPRSKAGAALPKYLHIEHARKPHDSTKTLSARLRDRANDRLAAYLRIARGRSV